MEGGSVVRQIGSGSIVLINHERLKRFVQSIFAAAGCRPPEDERIAHHLVEANLAGHDSHGVIRVSHYIDFLRKGMVRANQTIRVVFDSDALAVVDGGLGFGQVIGEQTMRLAIEKARKQGVAVVALRNSGHLGRIGDWPLIAVDAGLASLHFVNSNGFGILAAPFGGIDRRLSANPIAAGVPVPDGSHIILDISTCAIAEGKVRVARNKGTRVPPGCLIDSQGRPTDQPEHFYGDPPGAILPFGGHKGYGLGVIAEMFAGAISGNGCSNPARRSHMASGMLTITLDPQRIPNELGFSAEVRQFIQYVKSSRRAQPDQEILMPGELEQRMREQRVAAGIELDATTWEALVQTASTVGLDKAEFPAV
jgi:uncharacterized oxidoreductase